MCAFVELIYRNHIVRIDNWYSSTLDWLLISCYGEEEREISWSNFFSLSQINSKYSGWVIIIKGLDGGKMGWGGGRLGEGKRFLVIVLQYQDP